MNEHNHNDSRPYPTLDANDVYCVGRLGKSHGVKGEMTFLYDDDVFDRVDADYVFVKVDGLLVPFFFESYRFRSDETALVKWEDVDTADAAAELTGCEVFFPRQLADEDTDAPLSVAEIVGYQVIDAANGQTVGTIKAVDDATINTLFEVETPDGRSVVLPANADLIGTFDRAQHTVTMTIPDGVLNL